MGAHATDTDVATSVETEATDAGLIVAALSAPLARTLPRIRRLQVSLIAFAILAGAPWNARAQGVPLLPYPSPPYSEEECTQVHIRNNNSIGAWFHAEYEKVDPRRVLLAEQIMNHADSVNQRLSDQDSRQYDACMEVARANERHRAAQEHAANQAGSTVSQVNQAIETAKQTYKDAKRVGNLMINPRDEVGRIVGEKLAEFGQQGSELALRGTPGQQHPEYDARHDRVKDVNDAITQNEGVKAIQDSTLDELKRRNNKTLTALDDFDRELGEIVAATSKSAQQSSSTGSLQVHSSDTSSEQMSSDNWHYIDPRTGFRFDIPRGHVLYRDLITRSLSVVELSTINSFGDALDGGTCTLDGLGIVSPICEAQRGI